MARSRWISIIEFLSLAVFLCLWAARLPEARLSLVQVLIAYAAADAASGLIHWFADTRFAETTPILGRLLIQPFRRHHLYPADLTRHGLLELTGNSALFLLPVLLLPLPACLLLTFTASLVGANVFHKWAHQERPPVLARVLQRARVILPKHHHARHHATGRCAYCVTSGWLNPLLDRLLHAR
jgi:ubiquitin-conjugating enzyme E2 variant